MALCAGACTSSSAPTLTSGREPPIETGSHCRIWPSGQAPVETAIIVPGTPTEVYALVARGALGCWFGANGPLKATHVFHAEAAPPSQGGQAEIVLHERDVSLRDQRGARAFRVKFASDAAGVRVGITVVKIAPALAEPMVQDVAVWARGRSGMSGGGAGPAGNAAAPLQRFREDESFAQRRALSGARKADDDQLVSGRRTRAGGDAVPERGDAAPQSR